MIDTSGMGLIVCQCGAWERLYWAKGDQHKVSDVSGFVEKHLACGDHPFKVVPNDNRPEWVGK